MLDQDDYIITIEILEKFPQLAEVMAELIRISQQRKYGSLTVSFQNGKLSHFEIRTTHKIGTH
jgi:hypothetical protein